MKPIVIRKVWAHNLDFEFRLIGSALSMFRFASFDTEFPGTIHHSEADFRTMNPTDHYRFLKMNVDDLNLIQIGLSLSNESGELPDFGSDVCYIWEFNMKDFDIHIHKYAQDSVQLLTNQGIQFENDRQYGVSSAIFAHYMFRTRLLCNYSTVTWATFHSMYDFGYLIKAIIRRPLPNTLQDFLGLVHYYFGQRVFDMKYMMKFCGNNLYGGLEKVAKVLGVKREAGQCHQAGSDSLLTLQTFIKMKSRFFQQVDLRIEYGGVLFGLEVH